MTTFSGVPSDTAPYLELFKTGTPGETPEPVAIYPKLASRPVKMKFSPDKEVMVLVTNLRREETVGIGSDLEVVTDEGLKVFSNNDRFLFLGAGASSDPALYERTGPLYQNTGLLPLPVSGHALHAVFSQGGRWLFVVWSTAADIVQVYRWNGEDAEDVAGEFEEDSTFDAGATVTDLLITPGNTFLVVNTAATSAVLPLEGSPALVPVAPAPPGRVVAVSPDELEWVVWDGGTFAEVYDFADPVWTYRQDLAGTATAGTEAAYSPDGTALVLAGTGTGYPKSFAKSGTDWVVVYTETHGASVTYSGLTFRSDGEQMAATHATATEFYEKQIVYPSPLFEDVNDLSGDLSITTQANGEGSVIVYVDNTGEINYARDDGSGIGTKVTILGSFRDAAVSNIDGLGNFFLFAVNNSNAGFLWKIDGADTRTAITVPGLTGGTYRVAMTPDASYLSVVCDTGADLAIRVLQHDLLINSVTFMQDIVVPGEGATWSDRRRAPFAPDGTMISLDARGDRPSKMYKLDGGVWSAAPALPLPAGRDAYMAGPAWSSDSQNVYVAARAASGDMYFMGFARQPDDSFLLDFDPGIFGAATASPFAVATAPGNAGVAVTVNAVGPTSMHVWIADDMGDLIEVATPGTHASVLDSAPAWTVASLIMTRNTAPGTYAWLWIGLTPSPAYVLTDTFASVGPPSFWGYGPGDEFAHFGTSGEPHHLQIADMTTEATSLSFAPDWTAAQVYNMVFSPTRRAVVFNTPDGIEVATRNGAGPDFINSKDITGVFVTLYDIAGSKFKERGYAIHAIDTVLVDLTFSPTAQVLSYHANLPVGAPIDAARGRLLYDISTAISPRFEFRDQVYDANVTRSFIAFSPFETHFVVTLERDTTLHSVVLAEFTTDFNFVEQDEQSVAFGPPAFSHCDDVVVAHGGAVPFTFFKHDDVLDVLVPDPITITDWASAGVILDVMFNATCDGMIVLTDEELIPIEKDKDSADAGEATPLEEPIDEEDFDDAAVEPDDDEPADVVVVTTTTPGGGSGGPGSYTSGPIISSIDYVPYVVVTVSFRVNPVSI